MGSGFRAGFGLSAEGRCQVVLALTVQDVTIGSMRAQLPDAVLLQNPQTPTPNPARQSPHSAGLNPARQAGLPMTEDTDDEEFNGSDLLIAQ